MLLKRQELIEFDPSKKDHRAAIRAFMKRRAWVDSPLRFAYDPGYGSVVDQVQAKLLQWYVEQEELKENKIKKNCSSSKKLAFELMGIASEYKV